MILKRLKDKFFSTIVPVFTMVCFSLAIKSFSQTNRQTVYLEQDKCGFDEILARSLLKMFGDHWGYDYDSLLVDLQKWGESPYVSVDSLGASVQNRALWELTITDTNEVKPKRAIYIHARTHPGEVQGFWVTDEIINLLTSESDFAKFMRRKCVFYIIPMYNPDGVELEYPRENAHHVDIESNWYAATVEPEVATLRNRFIELMNSGSPIEVALNMHSAYACKRYFVYHDPVGTSPAYSVYEKLFIGDVRFYYLFGIEPWNYFVSWKTGTPLKYPESWFWLNYSENVMALTYEDINCENAGNYGKTAAAIIHGISNYLALENRTVVVDQIEPPVNFLLEQNYPNPFNLSTTISYYLPGRSEIVFRILDTRGREIKTIETGWQETGYHEFNWQATGLPSAIYFYQLTVAVQKNGAIRRISMVKKCTLLK